MSYCFQQVDHFFFPDPMSTGGTGSFARNAKRHGDRQICLGAQGLNPQSTLPTRQGYMQNVLGQLGLRSFPAHKSGKWYFINPFEMHPGECRTPGSRWRMQSFTFYFIY